MDTEPEPEPPAEAAPMKCLPVGAGGGAEKPSGSVEKKKKKNRCGACRKKVGLTGFDCKCGGLFCGLHRMASGHNCTFDHAAASKELLEGRLNSVIGMSEKFEKVRAPPLLAPLANHARSASREQLPDERFGCSRRSEGLGGVTRMVLCCEGSKGRSASDRSVVPTVHEMVGVRASAGPVLRSCFAATFP